MHLTRPEGGCQVRSAGQPDGETTQVIVAGSMCHRECPGEGRHWEVWLQKQQGVW